jgi:uncharacterized OsmC-like protein
VTGEVEVEGKVLVLKRVHAHYRLAGHDIDETVVDRVLGFHADGCPVARSIKGAIEVTTSYELA